MKRTLMIAAAALVVSCASYFLKGAKEYRGGPPPGAIASFTAKTCTATATGEKMGGPEGTYYLANTTRGPALYELDATGQGSAITNYWRDAEGHHFAAYVRGHQAWEYVLPDDRSKPGVRKVFLQYQIQGTPGGFRIEGQPTATCPLVNPQAAATPAAPTASTSAARPPPPPPPAVSTSGVDGGAPVAEGGAPSPAHPQGMICVPGSTQECVGSGACHGGQHCLSDGSGYSPCDCGKKTK
jgi:hypothetical protein